VRVVIASVARPSSTPFFFLFEPALFFFTNFFIHFSNSRLFLSMFPILYHSLDLDTSTYSRYCVDPARSLGAAPSSAGVRYRFFPAFSTSCIVCFVFLWGGFMVVVGVCFVWGVLGGDVFFLCIFCFLRSFACCPLLGTPSDGLFSVPSLRSPPKLDVEFLTPFLSCPQLQTPPTLFCKSFHLVSPRTSGSGLRLWIRIPVFPVESTKFFSVNPVL